MAMLSVGAASAAAPRVATLAGTLISLRPLRWWRGEVQTAQRPGGTVGLNAITARTAQAALAFELSRRAHSGRGLVVAEPDALLGAAVHLDDRVVDIDDR